MILAIIIALGVLALVTVLATAVVLRRTQLDERPSSDVDPLFIPGITLTGTSAALVITLGPAMYGMMALGGHLHGDRSQPDAA